MHDYQEFCTRRATMSVGLELDCLKDIRVVDFTQFEAGPSCTEALAWLGAEVVKIETLRTGDPGRRLQPGKPDNDPWYFHQFNANKKSVTLDLKSARGLEIVRALLKKADVTIENMAPGTIERLGLGYDEVKKINPGIIYCQVKGFGAGSPYEKCLAFDMIAQAAGGTISVTGDADRPPVKPGTSFRAIPAPACRWRSASWRASISAPGPARAVSRRWRCRMPCSTTCASRSPPHPALRQSRDARWHQPIDAGGSRPTLYPASPVGRTTTSTSSAAAPNPEHWQRLL
jgi:formyl-CoA transferase